MHVATHPSIRKACKRSMPPDDFLWQRRKTYRGGATASVILCQVVRPSLTVLSVIVSQSRYLIGIACYLVSHLAICRRVKWKNKIKISHCVVHFILCFYESVIITNMFMFSVLQLKQSQMRLWDYCHTFA